MTKDDIRAIRRLDIGYAKAFAERSGRPFIDGGSLVTGAAMTADEIALASLHKMRLTVGSKREKRASRQWLDQRGLVGPSWQGEPRH